MVVQSLQLALVVNPEGDVEFYDMEHVSRKLLIEVPSISSTLHMLSVVSPTYTPIGPHRVCSSLS